MSLHLQLNHQFNRNGKPSKIIQQMPFYLHIHRIRLKNKKKKLIHKCQQWNQAIYHVQEHVPYLFIFYNYWYKLTLSKHFICTMLIDIFNLPFPTAFQLANFVSSNIQKTKGATSLFLRIFQCDSFCVTLIFLFRSSFAFPFVVSYDRNPIIFSVAPLHSSSAHVRL